ncbi:RibD domain-containing protein [Humibacillus xanthopallidus]|uniref:RibD domain-containing protein n=1 Tax=Humibacillus xanthopallidus TaxID=412689 RepID=A0A543PPJ1_9MICO|nr:dihydrofolate reductase family protein [Humibacillus xanthopallidus]TQN45991.1 RibD domain-containing protein [Humibacillus xanthopallidus]
MARLLFVTMTSLDGYVADTSGGFEWAAPDREVHAFVNDLSRSVGTFVCGRRLHEVMRYWDTAPTSAASGDEDDGREDAEGAEGAEDAAVMADFAGIWQAADKVVHSRSLESVSSPRTRLERSFDPAALARFVAEADRDVSIGGPTLAAEALRAGIVDEVHVLRSPVIVGGGTAALQDGIRLPLTLLEARSFAGGTTYSRYAVRR